MKTYQALAATLFIAFATPFPVLAQASPVGLWQSVDDETGKPRAQIRIRESAPGVLSGVVEKSLRLAITEDDIDGLPVMPSMAGGSLLFTVHWPASVNPFDSVPQVLIGTTIA